MIYLQSLRISFLKVLFITIFFFFFFFFIILITIFVTIQIDDCILFILIFRDQIPHVLIRLLEFHLVHSLSFVPMQKGLPLVHLRKLSRDSLEHSLDRSGVGHESSRHITALWWHIDDGRFDV